MILLYDQAEAFGGLPIGTSNKTEILLGYTTIFGDSASAINPIGDLYKTQVRQLGRALGVPESILRKPPSADLWVGQTDEEELGFTYEEVDRLLYLLVDERYTPQECIEVGFEPAFVQRVAERVRRYQFKRVPPSASSAQRVFCPSSFFHCWVGSWPIAIHAVRCFSLPRAFPCWWHSAYGR